MPESPMALLAGQCLRIILLLAPNDDDLETLRNAAPDGVEVIRVDSNQPVEQQASQLKDAEAVIVIPSDIPVDLVRDCPKLRLVQVVNAGTNRIDIQSLGELGVKVANNGGGNAPAVAEHTIALMVGAYRKLQLQFQSVKDRKWIGDIRERWFPQAHELTGKIVGIVGLGHIGRSVARRLQGWDCDIIYNDVASFSKEVEEELNVTRVTLDELLRTSDIVTLHVPLDKQTTGMISDREFDMMKPAAVLINACRGPVVDEAALMIRALNENKIAAAGLDVLEVEPTPADNPLVDMDNVLITPHLAGSAVESSQRSRAFAVYNTAKVARGEEPESVVLPV